MPPVNNKRGDARIIAMQNSPPMGEKRDDGQWMGTGQSRILGTTYRGGNDRSFHDSLQLRSLDDQHTIDTGTAVLLFPPNGVSATYAYLLSFSLSRGSRALGRTEPLRTNW